jgi:mono/diheme cytochrome c family protein
MKLPGIAALVMTVGFILIFILVLGSSNASLASPASASAQDVYLDKCSVCHAQDGSGNTAKGRKLKVKNLRSPEVQKLSEADMINIIANGKGKDMDGFQKELGSDMLKNIAVYYRSLAK